MNTKKFLNEIGVKPTNDIRNNPKLIQLVNYIQKNNLSYLISGNYINPDKFLYFIENMKSLKNIVSILNNIVYLSTFNYDYKDLVKFFNVYDADKIFMIGGSSILIDKEYLENASVEWTQDVLVKSEKIIKLYKNKIVFQDNPYKKDDIKYISAFELNIRTLIQAKDEDRLKEVIKYATAVM